MIRLAILGSTRGTNLAALVAAIAAKQLPATIEIVISNKKDALILERAKAAGLYAVFVDPTHLTRAEYDAKVSALLTNVDLIVLIGYMRILSADFVHAWKNKIINVHPSLLPLHAGLMNLDVHRAVLAAGEMSTGCSVHYVTEEVDAGPVILQKQCEVLPGDTAESLRARVQALEGAALVEAIVRLL